MLPVVLHHLFALFKRVYFVYPAFHFLLAFMVSERDQHAADLAVPVAIAIPYRFLQQVHASFGEVVDRVSRDDNPVGVLAVGIVQ